VRSQSTCISILLVFLTLGLLEECRAQARDPQRELQLRAEMLYRQRQIEAFIENVYEFYEIGGELISFRVHPNMTRMELDDIDEKAQDLDDKADDMVSFIHYVAPRVRGKTDDLWVVLDPLDETATLEERLTLILSLVNGIEPKIDHLIEVLTEEREIEVGIDELVIEASLPFLIAGGLEELRVMLRDLRLAL
jgi:hypothetical protein